MADSRNSSTKRRIQSMKAVVHKHEDSTTAIKAFSEKRAVIAIGYVKNCSAAELRCLRHELCNESVRV